MSDPDKNQCSMNDPVPPEVHEARMQLFGRMYGDESIAQRGAVLSSDQTEIVMSPGLLDQAQQHVMRSPAFRPRNGNTYCNRATSSVLDDFGNHDLSSLQPAPNGSELPGRANEFHQYLNNQQTMSQSPIYSGVRHDYDQVGDDEAAELSESGVPVINSSRNRNPVRSGHLTTSAGRSRSGQHRVANVGASIGYSDASAAHGSNLERQNFVTNDAKRIWDLGIRPSDGLIITPSTMHYDPLNPEQDRRDFAAPNMSFKDAQSAQDFYGDRVAKVEQLVPVSMPR